MNILSISVRLGSLFGFAFAWITYELIDGMEKFDVPLSS